MAEQIVNPVLLNLSGQAGAVAGSNAVVFTSTDRKIIKERAGEVDRTRSFKDILLDKSITPKVENEESPVKPELDVKELEYRQRQHRQMLKESPIKAVRDEIELNEETESPSIVPKDMVKEAPAPAKVSLESVEIGKKTARVIRQFDLNPDEIVGKFAIEEKDLLELVYRIKDLHLKRLLTNDHAEFDRLSEEIKKETIGAAKPEAKEWLTEKLGKLRISSAEYKLKLITSLDTIGVHDGQDKNINWLKKVISGK